MQTCGSAGKYRGYGSEGPVLCISETPGGPRFHKHHTWSADSLGPLTCTLPLGYKTEALLSMVVQCPKLGRQRKKETQYKHTHLPLH